MKQKEKRSGDVYNVKMTEMWDKDIAIGALAEAIRSLALDNLANKKYEYAEHQIKVALSIVKRHNEKQ